MWGIHMNKRETGSCYEELAAVCLQKKGYRIIERNYRCRQGEVDLVCRHGRYLVFVEVKYRSTGRMGGPLEAVDRVKQKRIRAAAVYYMFSPKIPEDCPCRFDVVGILGDQVELIQDAF